MCCVIPRLYLAWQISIFALEHFILAKDSKDSPRTQFQMSRIHSFGEEYEETVLEIEIQPTALAIIPA